MKTIISGTSQMEVTQVSISSLRGPKVSFEFFDLKTWNALNTMHFKSRGNAMSQMRWDAYSKGLDFMEKQTHLGFGECLVNRALVHVKVYTPKEEISDIHNVCLKAIFDGFTDSFIWPDDEWAHLPLVIIQWAGMDTDVQWKIPTRKTKTRRGKLIRDKNGNVVIVDGKKQREPSRQVRTRKAVRRRTVIDIYELTQLSVAGISQELPLGRTRL